MDDFRASMDSSSSDPFEKIRINKILEKQTEQQLAEEELAQQKKRAKLAALLSFFSKKLLCIAPKKDSTQALISLDKALIKLKSSFEELIHQDLSQDTEFLKELSHHWLQLLDDFLPLSISKHPIILPLEKFIDEIHEFPKNTEFSLGYYLSEYAGLEWIPFPYMEILKNLYLEANKNPKDNHLMTWIDQIDKIIHFE